MSLENLGERVTLTGNSVVDEEDVVRFTANIAENGVAGSTTINIMDVNLYNEHRSQVREDQAEFQREVWDVEDRLTTQDDK